MKKTLFVLFGLIMVNALIVIAARNIAIIKPKNISPRADNRILQILDYI